MDEIKVDVQGVRIINNNEGTHQLVLVALNELWADVLLNTLGKSVQLDFLYDGYDITLYLVFKLPGIDKMFKVQVNVTPETRKWLDLINNKKINAIKVAYRDGKGSPIFYGKPVLVTS
jgi:hypothetical protein